MPTRDIIRYMSNPSRGLNIKNASGLKSQDFKVSTLGVHCPHNQSINFSTTTFLIKYQATKNSEQHRYLS